MADTEYPRAFRCARCRRMRFWVIAQSLEHEREIMSEHDAKFHASTAPNMPAPTERQ